MRETRNLLNLHLFFSLRISAKSWTAFCRDRLAPNCTIRHPVWPIVALQRRVRFSARLAGFCRGRCHQRRARRAERASFSVFVSNLDVRVPRSRQRGENTRTPSGSAVCTFPKAAYRPWPGRKHRHYAADLWSISKGPSFGTGREWNPCAPQKIDPALIARSTPSTFDCFWLIFFFADHRLKLPYRKSD